MSQEFPELGIYTLPGRISDPQRTLAEVPLAERLGLGSIWPAERYDFKNVEVLCGAAAAVSSDIKIATGLMNYPTHHPMELCSFGATMSHLSSNRFAMGFGRGFDALYDIFGTPRANMQGLTDTAEVLRLLWSGQTFSGENSLGNFPFLYMSEPPQNAPPLLLGAVGPKTLALAGRCYDGALLHPCLTNQAISEAVKIVGDAAEKAGRGRDACKVWATLVVAADQDEDETSAIGPARLLTYLHMENYGEMICKVNHWDDQVLKEVRAHPLFEGGKSADQDFTRYETAEVAALFPDHWMRDSAALGSAEHCASRINDQFDAGADGVLFHGSLPRQVEGLLDAYRKVRRSEHFAMNDPWFTPSAPGTGL
ncbi:MAG: 5,10-methylenetetrahydromethanopterin reductase [Halioglobus sp.]|jgi:5,10-methylenetetrahydromethanopterin reductase